MDNIKREELARIMGISPEEVERLGKEHDIEVKNGHEIYKYASQIMGLSGRHLIMSLTHCMVFAIRRLPHTILKAASVMVVKTLMEASVISDSEETKKIYDELT